MPTSPLPAFRSTLPSLSAPSLSSSSSPSSSVHPLVRKLLFPQLDPASPIPPIFSDAHLKELNNELYLFIALALRGYINPWYAKITPRDRDFLPRVTQVLVHVLCILPSRLSTRDTIVPFLLIHLPTVLTEHWRTTRVSLSLAQLHPPLSVEVFYHRIHPHVGISIGHSADKDGDDLINPVYWTCLAEGILKILLPAGDSGSELETVILREVLGRVVLGAVGRKFVQSSFWWSIGLGLLGTNNRPSGSEENESSQHFDQSLDASSHSRPSLWQALLNGLLLVLGIVQSIFVFGRNTFQALKTLRNLMSTCPPGRNRDLMVDHGWVLGPWVECVGLLLGLNDTLVGRVLWIWIEGLARLVCVLGGDRLIPHLLSIQLSSPELPTMLVIKLRSILFSNQGYPGPPVPDLSAEEQTALQVLLERVLEEKTPSSSSECSPIHELLVPLENDRLNAHLLLSIIDCFVLGVFPELGVGANEK
ncbi:PX-associated, sorting nexin 13 [Phaffia rhodozyma]|uniref:PX-associated, sorting nexin 13 n=1 Tax=Phaffia rhodozyma TaxID=264483 RepID=A0A0F7SEF2_PHARH|nr:PX-associated, sorting nexin 13 [Phaffia rhodozyma]